MEDLREMEVNGRAMFGRLAKIESVRLSTEDHGSLSLWVMLDYGGSGQGFGGYAMDEYFEPWKRRRGSAFGTDYILCLLATFGVSKLEDLEGRYCFALVDDKSFSASVRGLLTTSQDGSKAFVVRDLCREWGISTE